MYINIIEYTIKLCIYRLRLFKQSFITTFFCVFGRFWCTVRSSIIHVINVYNVLEKSMIFVYGILKVQSIRWIISMDWHVPWHAKWHQQSSSIMNLHKDILKKKKLYIIILDYEKKSSFGYRSKNKASLFSFYLTLHPFLIKYLWQIGAYTFREGLFFNYLRNRNL